MEYNKIIFVAQTGTCREAMAAGIFGDFALKHPLEIQTRGLVVQFPDTFSHPDKSNRSRQNTRRNDIDYIHIQHKISQERNYHDCN